MSPTSPTKTTNDLEMSQMTSSNSKQFTGAIYLRNAYASYGFKFKKVQVFNNLNITVEKGSVYSLLGASGCGKTTVLNCVLGYKKLDSGQIWVLGGSPGTRNSVVPGTIIGYMPQDTALYKDLTITETLIYFGWLAGMNTNEIREQDKFLTDLLSLPETNEPIRNLSGGQQRRVSFAAALVHSPELLILDEPTVGLDAIVRETVWQYLNKIALERGTTILITTHYIEEAGNCSCVALLRNRSILVEEPPQQLIRRFKAQSLEEVFFKLSVVQETKIEGRNETNRDKGENILPALPPQTSKVDESLSSGLGLNMKHIRAIVWRELLWLARNVSHVAIILLLPIIGVILVVNCIGLNPNNISVAVVNFETNYSSNCNSLLTCNNPQISCSYLQYLEKHGVDLIYYNSKERAIQSVLSGENYASIVIPFNYTEALKSRFDNSLFEKTSSIEFSHIEVVRDGFNKIAAVFIKGLLYSQFETFVQDYGESCGYPRAAFKIPITFENPIYGTLEHDFTNSVIPGLIIGIVFLIAIVAAFVSILAETEECSATRSFALNVRMEELLFSHAIVDSITVLFQVILILVLMFGIFHKLLEGSLVLVFCICYLTGVCGICYGLMLSVFCNTITPAAIIATGTFLSTLLLGGVLWPIEGMHYLLKPIVYFSPLTNVIFCLRDILARGWGLPYRSVYMGFVTINMWSIIFLIVTIVYSKSKR